MNDLKGNISSIGRTADSIKVRFKNHKSHIKHVGKLVSSHLTGKIKNQKLMITGKTDYVNEEEGLVLAKSAQNVKSCQSFGNFM